MWAAGRKKLFLRRDAKERFDEAILRPHVLRRNGGNLAFAQSVQRFVARPRDRGTAKGAEVAAGFDPAFDSAMILFTHVVEVFDRPMLAASGQHTLFFERLDSRWVARVFVRVDDARCRVVVAL